MNLSELFTSQTIAAYWSEAGSNRTPYLGEGLFPSKKKAGLDLSWIKGHKGLPISLAPSNFDAKASFRDRIGVSKIQTEMPFFREGMLISEKDRQEILRAKDSKDPYVESVLAVIFNDAGSLIEGANVAAERMRMQLLSSAMVNHQFQSVQTAYLIYMTMTLIMSISLITIWLFLQG